MMAYSYENDPTNADSKPLYNNSIFNIFKWFADSWGCNDWITWHKANVAKYGIEAANNKFLDEWGNLALVTTTSDCKTWNTAFRDYLKKYGILDEISNPISNVVGAGSDVISNVGSGFSGASKILKIAIPLLMIFIIVYAVIYITKFQANKK